jgi:hypothetical protein
MLTEEQFQAAVYEAIEAHPEWAPGLMEAARQGLLERVRRDAQRAADMETIAITALARTPARSLRRDDMTLILDKLRVHEGGTTFRWEHVVDHLRKGAAAEAVRKRKNGARRERPLTRDDPT